MNIHSRYWLWPLWGLLIWLHGCASRPPGLETLVNDRPRFVVEHSDSLVQAYADQDSAAPWIARACVTVADSIARVNPRSDQALTFYQRAHSLDPDNRDASYGIWMIRGRQFYKKGGNDDLWDGIQAFATAARFRPQSGMPVLWMARSYLKKDDDDFELILETYRKALNLSLPDSLRATAEQELREVERRKKVLDDFWK
ncbi:MAG: hypothetical protein D6762_03490 [Candidatus Neomarinimicrobiota bacterium]|nr:MAG: hypothetical protein D6762_03490 [Candidatus Neomarinimicrobiota bacterium]